MNCTGSFKPENATNHTSAAPAATTASAVLVWFVAFSGLNEPVQFN